MTLKLIRILKRLRDKEYVHRSEISIKYSEFIEEREYITEKGIDLVNFVEKKFPFIFNSYENRK